MMLETTSQLPITGQTEWEHSMITVSLGVCTSSKGKDESSPVKLLHQKQEIQPTDNGRPRTTWSWPINSMTN